MARTANVPGTTDITGNGRRVVKDADGKVVEVFNKLGKRVQWRDASGVLVTQKKNSDEIVPVQFSISASISEAFDLAVTKAAAAHYEINSDEDEDEDEDATEATSLKAASRAAYIRTVVSQACGYDLSLDPVKDRGEGIREWHAKAKKASATVDVLASVLASNPELAAQLAAAGVVLE